MHTVLVRSDLTPEPDKEFIVLIVQRTRSTVSVTERQTQLITLTREQNSDSYTEFHYRPWLWPHFSIVLVSILTTFHHKYVYRIQTSSLLRGDAFSLLCSYFKENAFLGQGKEVMEIIHEIWKSIPFLYSQFRTGIQVQLTEIPMVFYVDFPFHSFNLNLFLA